MARNVSGDYYGTTASVLTKADNANIGEGRLSLRVTSERGSSGQIPLSQSQALELAVVLIETVRELAEGNSGT